MKYIANPVQVEAHRIIEVGDLFLLSGPDPSSEHQGRRLTLDNGCVFTADPGMLARMTPAVGDYVVIQEDGYTYLNPKYVFERKYSPADVDTVIHSDGSVHGAPVPDLRGIRLGSARHPYAPLSAKILCFELARLITNRLGLDADAFTVQWDLADGDTFAMYAPGEMGGLQVSVKTMPTEFGIVAAGKTAAVEQGGADRFLCLDAYSTQFLQPAAAVLCNCLSLGVASV